MNDEQRKGNHPNKIKDKEEKNPRQSGIREKEKIPTYIYVSQERKSYHICIYVMKEKNRRCITNVIKVKGIIPSIIGKILRITSKTDADHNNLCILYIHKTPNAFL